jgi:hypothetical protein
MLHWTTDYWHGALVAVHPPEVTKRNFMSHRRILALCLLALASQPTATESRMCRRGLRTSLVNMTLPKAGGARAHGRRSIPRAHSHKPAEQRHQPQQISVGSYPPPGTHFGSKKTMESDNLQVEESTQRVTISISSTVVRALELCTNVCMVGIKLMPPPQQ